MSLKRKSQPIVEEEDRSESSDLEVVDVEDSDHEDELPRLKKRKKLNIPPRWVALSQISNRQIFDGPNNKFRTTERNRCKLLGEAKA